ncbi:unnamed protein product [Camellia sinensis]
MERYYKRKSSMESSSSPIHDIRDYDPRLRIIIVASENTFIGCTYQPHNHNFPRRKIGQSSRRFNPSWFAKFGGRLEYNIAKYAAFCLCCYHFKPVIGDKEVVSLLLLMGFQVGRRTKGCKVTWEVLTALTIKLGENNQNENLRAVLSKDVPEHLKLTTPSIQKDILNAIAVETTNSIVRELGDGMFSIVIDKSWDASMEEQFIVSFSMWKVGDM